MKSFLVIYSTVDGHTKNISNTIASHLEGKFKVRTVSLNDVSREILLEHDKILIGASIRYGKYRDSVFKLIKDNIDVLEEKTASFFSVNVVARKNNKNRPGTNPYVIKFLKQTPWKPKYVGVFAGKVEYPKYGFFDKYIIRLIMWITKGPTDISKSYEFTDWESVEDFSRTISM